MPIKKRSKSILKKIRQTKHRYLRNRRKRIRLKAAIKKVRGAKTKAEALTALRSAQSIIDKSVQDRIIHKNTAGRYLSRLSQHIKRLK